MVNQDPKRNLISPGSNAQNPLNVGSVANKPGPQAHPPQLDKDLTPNGLRVSHRQQQER